MIYIRGGYGNPEQYSEEAERIIKLFEELKEEEGEENDNT